MLVLCHENNVADCFAPLAMTLNGIVIARRYDEAIFKRSIIPDMTLVKVIKQITNTI